jgi:hypothetical protein
MAIFSGPEIPNSGLVFHYDTGNTVKSWKGAPTTNVIAANFDSTFDTLADNNTAGFNNQLGTGNYLGVSSTRGYQSSKSLRINNGAGGTARVYRIYPVSLGEYSSVSAWVYSIVPGPFITIEYAGGDYSWIVGQTRNTHTGKGWELLWTRANNPATSATSGHFFLYPGVDNTDTYWDNIQVEKQQYPTPYVNGTRSNTEAVVDLTGNNTITASSLTYASDGTFSFNGTSNLLVFPENSLMNTNSPTVEVWIKTAALSQNGFWFEKGTVNSSYSLFQEGTNIIWRTVNSGSPPYDNLYVATASYLSTSSWAHIVGTYTTGNKRLYINGMQVANNTVSGTIATNANGCSIGVYGGFSGSRGYWYNGNIGNVKVYNRALSAAEVQQNFEATRGRYGI